MENVTEKLDENKTLLAKIQQGDNFKLSDEERQKAEEIQQQQEKLEIIQGAERMQKLIDYKLKK